MNIEYREQTRHCRKAEVMWTGKVEVKYGVNCPKMSAKTFPSWPRLHLSQMNGTNVVGIHGQFHIEAGTSIQSKGHLYKIRKLFIGSSLQVDGNYRCPNCNFPLCSPDCAQGIHALVSTVNNRNNNNYRCYYHCAHTHWWVSSILSQLCRTQ